MKFLLRASAGLFVWAASFSLLYALQGLNCALRWHDITMPFGTAADWILTTTWSIFMVISSHFIRKANRLPMGLERQLALSSAVIGLVAIIITGSPVLGTSSCSGLHG